MRENGTSGKSGWFAQDAGTASVEIVVMLPVFIALYAAIPYLHGLATAHLEAKDAARSCVWQYALSGCEGKPPCGLVEKGVPNGLSVQVPGGSLGIDVQGQITTDFSYFDAVSELPLVGPAVKSVFGVGKRLEATRPAAGYLGGAGHLAAESQYVLCNVKAQSWSDKIGELLDFLSPS